MKRPTLQFGQLLYDLDTQKGRYTSYFLYLLNIIFLSVYIIGTYDFSRPYQKYIIAVEFCLALVFLFEYLSRLDYADSTLAEATDFYSIADLLAILPALLIIFLPIVGQLAFFRSVQIFRVFRFVRLGLENDRFFNYELTSRQVITAELLILVFIILNLHAGAIWGFESGINEDFNNYGDALYYSVVALTTTGFGNTVPITTGGKMATAIGLIAAVTLIPWLVVRARETGETDIQCSRCGNSKHYSESNYCWRCGEELEDTQTERTTQ
ncbi:MAG: potassium channel family protein [Halolamina sp.]